MRLLLAALVFFGAAQEKLPSGWLDLDAGFAEAKSSGKPLLVVLRCEPCKEARAIDRVLMQREDAALAAVSDRFVRVRITQGYGLDLSLFQFDWRSAWQVMTLNADRAIYTRYGAHGDDAIGLRHSLEAALELHAAWPANRAELAGKLGAPFRWAQPQEIPALKAEGLTKPARGRDGCIHCHDILKGAEKSLAAAGEPVPLQISAPYPMPQRSGLMLSTKERALVTDVDKKSPAEKAGIREGDRLLRFGGQPVSSWADVQWVLWTAGDAAISVELDRAGSRIETTLTLPPGWRTR